MNSFGYYNYPSFPVYMPPAFQIPWIVPQSQALPQLISKKYQRTWKKSQVEEAFIAATQYCIVNSKRVEDLKIEDFQQIGLNFKQTPEQIMMKVNEINKSQTLRPGIWSDAEDELLLSLLKKGLGKWGKIANFLNSDVHGGLKIRTGKMCKERWNNYLNPEINRGMWTDAEDVLILEKYKIFGCRWSLIAKCIKDRTESSVKNRIKSLLNKLKQDSNSSQSESSGIERIISEKKTQISENFQAHQPDSCIPEPMHKHIPKA